MEGFYGAWLPGSGQTAADRAANDPSVLTITENVLMSTYRGFMPIYHSVLILSQL